MILSVLSKIFYVFAGILTLVFVYNLCISVFGWIKRKEKSAKDFPIKNKFAILIAAHNEEKVIASAVRSVNGVDYPKDMYDIYVIADNCDDETAKVAKNEGAIVYERFDNEKRGKGYSLEWMFENLFKLDIEYDAVCILDADNLVSSNFFLEMNKRLCQGNKVIQGYLDSKNPNDSWVSGNYSIAYWISNRVFQLPRYYLGLSCELGGTGFVMSVDVLKEIGWGATCLTEDLEFSLKLVQRNMKVSWSHDAIAYDEKPLKLSQSFKQRKRWMQGHCNCASRYLVPLLKKGLKDKDMVALDAALYLIQPFTIVAGSIGFVRSCIAALITLNVSNIFTMSTTIFLILSLLATYINIVFVIVEGKFSKKMGLYFLLFPFYSLTWIPIIVAGFIDRNKKDWVHTEHTRDLEIKDMKRLEKVG